MEQRNYTLCLDPANPSFQGDRELMNMFWEFCIDELGLAKCHPNETYTMRTSENSILISTQDGAEYVMDYCDEILSPGDWESILLMVPANVGLVEPGIPMNDSSANEQCSTKSGAKPSDELLPSTSAEPERIWTKDRIQSCVSQPLLERCSGASVETVEPSTNSEPSEAQIGQKVSCAKSFSLSEMRAIIQEMTQDLKTVISLGGAPIKDGKRQKEELQPQIGSADAMAVQTERQPQVSNVVPCVRLQAHAEIISRYFALLEQQNDERVQEGTRRAENLRRELHQIRFDPRIETAARFIGRFEHLEILAIGLSGDMRVSQEEVARTFVEAVRQVCPFIPTLARVAETQGRRLTLVELKGIFTRAQEIQPRVLERPNDNPRHYDSSDQVSMNTPCLPMTEYPDPQSLLDDSSPLPTQQV
ncbi:hypothetical protein QAD02_013195 [Eretmocerus hayati]|uniref:Uncharacterized protein n=1 Tax=Eretmocerus hayati TaxID=131215 RepID=A0ACC2P1R8_9HYME|nr:hypothetical protein QAD02_013195 [Eretmocerus hayati]